MKITLWLKSLNTNLKLEEKPKELNLTNGLSKKEIYEKVNNNFHSFITKFKHSK